MPQRVGALSVTPRRIDGLGADDLCAWRTLFTEQAAPANPFLDPAWILGWYRHFTTEADRLLLFITQTATGELVGVAPYFRQHVKVGPVRLAARLMPAGSGQANSPLEMPGFLAAREFSRDVAKVIVAVTMSHSPKGWSEATFGPSQSWFEPEWVYNLGQDVAFFEHHRARACIVLRLAETWDATRTQLKRNVKESIRRSQNRMKKDGRSWQVVTRTGADLDDAAVCRFLELHRSRSANERATVHHHDAYADAPIRHFVRDVLPELAAHNLATLFDLELDGRVVASQLALHAPRMSYIHSSGFLPEVWDFGPVTFLHSQVIKAAIERGDTLVNFSPGPNVSKMRWSEELVVLNDFVYGAGPALLRWRFTAYSVLSTLRSHAQIVAFSKKSSGPRTAAVAGPTGPAPAVAAPVVAAPVAKLTDGGPVATKAAMPQPRLARSESRDRAAT